MSDAAKLDRHWHILRISSDDLPGKHLLTDAVQEPAAEASIDDHSFKAAVAVYLTAISCTVLSPRSTSSATAALNWSEKFRRFVILVSIRSGWIHLSTLSEFAGPLHSAKIRFCRKLSSVVLSACMINRLGKKMLSFKGSQFPKDVILHAVFFYVRYGVSYRDLEEILTERGGRVDYVILNRWVVTYAS